MTFDQQSQTELTMYDPQLSDMNRVSAKKQYEHKEMVEEEEDEIEEVYVQKRKNVKRVQAPKRMPKRQVKSQRKNLRDYVEEDDYSEEEEEGSIGDQTEEEEEEVVEQKTKRHSKR